MSAPTRNDEAELDIERLNSEAQGVARRDGFVWFVVGAMPGERVRARVIKPGARSCVARVMRIVEPSPDRVEPPCPVYVRCGGCAAQHMAYGATLDWKAGVVRDCLERIGGIRSPLVRPTVGMEQPWRYRNKGAFPVAGKVGSAVIGCYAPRSHEVIDAPDGCALHKRETNLLVEAVRGWMKENRVEPYDEARHEGLVRRIVTRVNRDGKSMLTIVVREAQAARLPGLDALVRGLREAGAGLEGVAVSRNPSRGNAVFGPECRAVWGVESLEERLELSVGALSYYLSPRSFFQVNTRQAERLAETVLGYVRGAGGSGAAADVYCGAGTLTLALAKAGFEAVGVELVEDAVRDARRNAVANGLAGVRFEQGDAAVSMPELVRKYGRFDVIVMDPPRKGCDRAVLEAAARAGPSRVVYVSCDPATLARDAATLAGLGYQLEEATPIDQFCWTASIETVALFRHGGTTYPGHEGPASRWSGGQGG
ncbi:MAG: 23S rRNA (uracil(1939)-C(5))-methyltransferase RlmD [Oscillospiraceae bacterium]|jgi:23S rRNA (uracil1939-C5)-methyltransferase|nr:23S rRNA (uracil(1939)-C(5))-methyltransferase RlmD [Oscillospiraceae bacterium]